VTITAAGSGSLRIGFSAGLKTAAITTALLCGVSGASLLLGVDSASANDDCVFDEAGITCSGDQSGGISLIETDSNLYVLDLNGDIAPVGATGIRVDTEGEISVLSNTGAYAIDVTGETGDGIALTTYGQNTSAILDHTGDITVESGSGIIVESWAGSSSTSTGDITAAGDGIRVKSAISGIANVTHDGAITSTGGYGINAIGAGSVDVDFDGTITSKKDGIRATSSGSGGDATVAVDAAGTITSSAGYGVYAESAFHETTVKVDGNIEGYLGGIVVKSTGDSSDAIAKLVQDGTVKSSAGNGISVSSAFHAASVDSTGLIDVYGNGVVVTSTGTASDATVIVKRDGNIISAAGSGIIANASHHSVKVTSDGDIDAYVDGIVAISTGTDYDATAIIVSDGDVTATTGRGLYANSASRTASIDSTGVVTAGGNAITAISTGTGSDASAWVKQNGNVTSTGGSGIVVNSASASARVSSSGVIDAQVDGIVVVSTGTGDDATAKIVQVGNVTAETGRGLYVNSANRSATIDNKGVVISGGNAITAISTGSGSDATAWVKQTGNVTSTGGAGITVSSANSAASVTSNGDISALYDGIYAKSTGAGEEATARVVHTGAITSTQGYGIYAESSRQGVVVDSSGTIMSSKDGIRAISTGASSVSTVKVEHDGNITSSSGAAVYASATNEGVTVVTVGDLSGATGGIVARSTGNSETSAVHVTHTGDITTSAGAGIDAYSSGKDVTVTVKGGEISGATSGIKAQSESEGVFVTVKEEATVSAGSKAAVEMLSITGASLDNYGDIDGGLSKAITSQGYGGTVVNNFGTIAGVVDIDDAYSVFNNQAGGLYLLSALSFSNGGVLNNYGTVSPGGDGVVTVASVDGDYVQSAGGTLLIDIDGASSDLVNVAGTASMAGTLQLNFVNLAGAGSARTILTSAGLTDESLSLVTGMAVVGGTISYLDGTDVVVDVDFNFAPTGLGSNGSSIATALNNAFEDEDTEMGNLLAGLANVQTIEDYETALAELSPEIYTQNSNATQGANQVFTDRLLSCRVQDGAYAFNAEGECVWFNVGVNHLDRDATGTNVAYSQDSSTLSFGTQSALDADWRFGAGFGYTQRDGSNTAGASVSGGQVEAGAVLKYSHEAVNFAASLTAGYAGSETNRVVDFGGFEDEVIGYGNSAFLAGRLHAAYTHDMGGVYIKPMAELNLMQLETAAYSETGGQSALNIDATSQTIVSLDPALEIGTELALNETAVVRPYLRAGVSVIAGADQELTASFVNGDGTSFVVASEGDEFLGKVAAGADVLGFGDMTLRLYYEGSFSDSVSQNGAGVKFGSSF